MLRRSESVLADDCLDSAKFHLFNSHALKICVLHFSTLLAQEVGTILTDSETRMHEHAHTCR